MSLVGPIYRLSVKETDVCRSPVVTQWTTGPDVQWNGPGTLVPNTDGTRVSRESKTEVKRILTHFHNCSRMSSMGD